MMRYRANVRSLRTWNQRACSRTSYYLNSAPLRSSGAAMIAREEANWKDLFAGFESLKVITYSSGLDVIVSSPVCSKK